MTESASDPFARVAPVWRSCFALAWESFQAGSFPVGAALVDQSGRIVRTGRNLSNEKVGPDGHIVGSNIGHAEVNALATLPIDDYPEHILYSTLEPCLLCTAAARYSHVATVRFAAPDPMCDGIAQVPEVNQHLARRWPRREGPLGGPFQTWGSLLPLVSAVERGIASVQRWHAEAMPEVLHLAQRWAGAKADHLRALKLDEALAVTWSEFADLR